MKLKEQRNNLWRKIEGFKKFRLDDDLLLSQDIMNQLPEELGIRNSKKQYLGWIIFFSIMYSGFGIIASIDPTPFIDAYNKSKFWSIATLIFMVGTLTNFIYQYFNKKPRIWLDQSGIRYGSEFVSWYSAEDFELVFNSNNRTYSIIILNKNGEILGSLNVTHLEIVPDKILTLWGYFAKDIV